MAVTEKIADKSQNSLIKVQEEFSNFVELSLETSARCDNSENLTTQQKAQEIEQWAKSHSSETPVILNDSREFIYED